MITEGEDAELARIWRFGPFAAALVGGAASLIGGAIGARAQARENAIDRERQDNQLQRMQKDAALAGIHPVAAMGLSGSHGAPVGGGAPGAHFGRGLAEAGGHVKDAILANNDYTLQSQQLDLDRQRLQNEIMAIEAQSRTMQMLTRQATAEPFGTGATGLLVPGDIPAQPATDDFGDAVGDIFFGVPNFVRAVVRGEGIYHVPASEGGYNLVRGGMAPWQNPDFGGGFVGIRPQNNADRYWADRDRR